MVGDYILAASAIATALAAMATVPKLLFGSVPFYVRLKREFRLSLRRSDLVVIPTPDEVAKYSIKVPDYKSITREEYIEELSARAKAPTVSELDKRERLLTLMMMFAWAFTYFELKMIFLGLSSKIGWSQSDTTFFAFWSACVLVIAYLVTAVLKAARNQNMAALQHRSYI